MTVSKRSIGLIVCGFLSCTAFGLAFFASLIAIFPNMGRHVVAGHITIVDGTENSVVQIGPELSTDGTIQVRGKDGAWQTVQLISARQP